MLLRYPGGYFEAPPDYSCPSCFAADGLLEVERVLGEYAQDAGFVREFLVEHRDTLLDWFQRGCTRAYGREEIRYCARHRDAECR